MESGGGGGSLESNEQPRHRWGAVARVKCWLKNDFSSLGRKIVRNTALDAMANKEHRSVNMLERYEIIYF